MGPAEHGKDSSQCSYLEVLQHSVKEALGCLGQNGRHGSLDHTVGTENVLRELDKALSHFGLECTDRIVDEDPANAPSRHEIPLGQTATGQHRSLVGGWVGGRVSHHRYTRTMGRRR